MKDLSPEDAGRWMDAAPQMVQDAVTSPVTEQVIEQLGKQYALHVDVTGLLLKLTSYMLLGYTGPEEFLQEMRTAGVSDEQARQIIDEINKKIFVPLREKMRQTTPISSPPPPPPPPMPMPMPAPRPPQASVPVPSYVPPKPPVPPTSPQPAQPQTYFHLENKIPPPKVEVPETRPAPMIPTIEPQKTNSEKLLEDHEEPHIEFSPLPKVIVPPVSSTPLPPSKPYTVDPYREPVDEK